MVDGSGVDRGGGRKAWLALTASAMKGGVCGATAAGAISSAEDSLYLRLVVLGLSSVSTVRKKRCLLGLRDLWHAGTCQKPLLWRRGDPDVKYAADSWAAPATPWRCPEVREQYRPKPALPSRMAGPVGWEGEVRSVAVEYVQAKRVRASRRKPAQSPHESTSYPASLCSSDQTHCTALGVHPCPQDVAGRQAGACHTVRNQMDTPANMSKGKDSGNDAQRLAGVAACQRTTAELGSGPSQAPQLAGHTLATLEQRPCSAAAAHVLISGNACI